MLSCSIWFSAPSFWMGGGLESRCVNRVYSADVITYKYNTSVINKTFYFIYNGIYVRVTCFDIVGHPQALQEDRSKSCLVVLHCGIPYA